MTEQRAQDLGKGQVDFPPILAELQQISAQRERLVLAIEMDLDEGDEDDSVQQCVRYMTDWFAQQSDVR